jgi:hypothetical protein
MAIKDYMKSHFGTVVTFGNVQRFDVSGSLAWDICVTGYLEAIEYQEEFPNDIKLKISNTWYVMSANEIEKQFGTEVE